MNIEVWTNEWKTDQGFPVILDTYQSVVVPQVDNWIALSNGEGGAFPTWRVVKVVHIPEFEKVKIQVSGV